MVWAPSPLLLGCFEGGEETAGVGIWGNIILEQENLGVGVPDGRAWG